MCTHVEILYSQLIEIIIHAPANAVDIILHGQPDRDARILELADETGQFCGKLLGDLSADIVKIEPPGGDPCRKIGPFLDDIPDPELRAGRRVERAAA